MNLLTLQRINNIYLILLFIHQKRMKIVYCFIYLLGDNYQQANTTHRVQYQGNVLIAIEFFPLKMLKRKKFVITEGDQLHQQ